MEIILIKKFRKTFTAIIIIGITCLGLIIAIIAAGFLNSRLNAKVAAQEKKLIIYTQTLGNNPEQAIALKKSLKTQLVRENEQINDAYVKETVNDPAANTPLSFKQLLYSTQDRLKSLAIKQNMGLPLWLGFDEYKINVPDAENTDVLIRELSISEMLIKGALDSGVSSVESIKFSHQRLLLVIGEKKIKYLPVSLSLKSSSGQIKAFLMNISKLPGVFSVTQLKIKGGTENKNQLATEINLKFIEI
jgi:hypothetical protein